MIQLENTRIKEYLSMKLLTTHVSLKDIEDKLILFFSFFFSSTNNFIVDKYHYLSPNSI